MSSCFSARAVATVPSRSSASSSRSRRSPSSAAKASESSSTGTPSGGANLPSEGGSRISTWPILADLDGLQLRLAGRDRGAAGIHVGLGRLDAQPVLAVVLL